MNLLNSIQIDNFKCFRGAHKILLSQGTYLIGANNAGKSAVLQAIRCFFEEDVYSNESFLNKTEFASKGKGYNRTQITIEFNINALTIKKLVQEIVKKYGNTLFVTKIFTFRPITRSVVVQYNIGNRKFTSEALPEEIRRLIRGVQITYLHPQEGVELLKNAQKKLRTRLLTNWGKGRYSKVTKNLKDLQKSWDNLRNNANVYLSSSLTDSLQRIWAGSQAKINLPKRIDDIINISDISFQGDKKSPEIELTSQGTGAQSAILYLTHFLLDSDKSLHRDEYHPLWLVEEPESFLHADLMFKIGKELNSDAWLGNIQMVISSHSPIILATSKLNEDKIMWNLIGEHFIKEQKLVQNWNSNEIRGIGQLMGDSNFCLYFLAATKKDLIFIEDSRSDTMDAFTKNDIDITKGLSGTSEVKKYIDFFEEFSSILDKNVYFIIDSDKGKKEFTRYLKNECKNTNGFSRYKITEKVFLITLPENSTIEDMFGEFDNFLEECASKLFDPSFSPSDTVPGYLSRAHAFIRGRQDKPKDKSEAKQLIKNIQDVKDAFWKKIKQDNLIFTKDKSESFKTLLEDR